MSPYTDFGQHTYDVDDPDRLSVSVQDADNYFSPLRKIEGKKWRDQDETRKTAALVEAQDLGALSGPDNGHAGRGRPTRTEGRLRGL